MHSEPDIWTAGREAQRDEVRAALAPRPRTCPTCGHVQVSRSAHCEKCGGEMVLRHQGPGKRRIGLIAGLVIAVAAALTFAFVPGMLDSARDKERADAARQARLEAAERARLTKDVQPRTARVPKRRAGEDQLAYRQRLVQTAQAVITADALRRVAEGTVDGPIKGASCRPYPTSYRRTAQEQDPAIARNRYQCIAYETKVPLTELNGQARTGIYGTPYWLILDYSGAPMTFCKITPKPGEGGKALAGVPVPPVCRDPLR